MPWAQATMPAFAGMVFFWRCLVAVRNRWRQRKLVLLWMPTTAAAGAPLLSQARNLENCATSIQHLEVTELFFVNHLGQGATDARRPAKSEREFHPE
jgi:hypothetical protein